MKKIIYYWDVLISSFWFIPILIILIGIVFAFSLIYLDGLLDSSGGIWDNMLIDNPDSARTILSTISAAMIGVAGTVFSIILVVLVLTTSQYGSRLVKNFMYVRLNQVVLGSYVSTFAYCLIVLGAIRGSTFVPSISVMIAILGAVVNVVLLIVFIHRVAMSIQVENVISGISNAFFSNLKNSFPDEAGRDEKRGRGGNAKEHEFDKKRVFTASDSGYIRNIDYDSLIAFAEASDALIEIHFRPGDHMIERQKLGTVHSRKELEDGAASRLASAFSIGMDRNPRQDPEHSILQIVEIACRALSPGINDPFTAIACIDNLTIIMCRLVNKEFPSRFRYDGKGRKRLVIKVLTFEEMLDTCFDQIRHFSEGNPPVILRLMGSLHKVHQCVEDPEPKEALRKHARMVLSVAKRSIKEENDLEKVRKKSREILFES